MFTYTESCLEICIENSGNVLNYSNDLETSLKIVENSQSSNIGDENDHIMEENVPVNLTPGNYKKIFH